MDLFTDDTQKPPALYGVSMPYSLDLAIATFLNRWIPRVLSAENRPTIEAELRELIADAKGKT